MELHEIVVELKLLERRLTLDEEKYGILSPNDALWLEGHAPSWPGRPRTRRSASLPDFSFGNGNQA